MNARVLCCSILVLLAALACAGQSDFPKKIDGYKVHTAKVLVTREPIDPKADADVIVRLDEPSISNVGFTGVSLDISGEVRSNRSGKIERLKFHDFRVNGISVNVVEVTEPMAVKTAGTTFQRRMDVSLGPLGAAKVAYKELTDPKTDWTVTGTVFAFGKFDRFGLTFKRVIPVKVTVTVKNPIR